MRFGDIVKYRVEEYVYLVQTDEIIYLAKIPNVALSEQLTSLRKKVYTLGSKEMVPVQEHRSWCFVVLSTEKFKNRIAHYGQPGIDYDPEDFMDKIGVLDFEDQKKIKGEIEIDTAMSEELRRLVKDITIEEA